MVLFNIWRALQHVHLTNINSHEEKNVLAEDFSKKKRIKNSKKADIRTILWEKGIGQLPKSLSKD